MKTRTKKWLAGVFGLAVAAVTVTGTLLYTGVWHINHPSADAYPVRGVDVSSYQGEIDWPVLAGQDMAFAFIKATEGSTFVDDCFAKNWREAAQTDLRVGAYHFFSFESFGEQQAAHYIRTVGPRAEGTLPPVIDVEYYDAPVGTDLSPAAIRRELQAMVQALTDFYGCPPILYVTEETYTEIVQGYFADCPLWVRSVYGRPRFVGEGEWTFWQYSNRHRLDGYTGRERYIDMNVYNGDLAAFEQQFSSLQK